MEINDLEVILIYKISELFYDVSFVTSNLSPFFWTFYSIPWNYL